MALTQPRSSLGRTYLAAVPWIGTAVLLWALADLVLHPPDSSWWALATLTILTGSFTVKIPGLVARLSVSEPFVFAATLWFGPSVGAVTAALDALIMSLWLLPGLKTLHRLSFNVSVLVISIWTASQLFFAISGIDVRAPRYTSLTHFVGPLYIFTACCFLINSGMVATALAIERGQSGLKIWREQFLWLSLNYFGGASVAALLVVYTKSIDWAVIGLIVPLLAISYLTFRTTLGRLEDANEHLTELNQLHLSTIETLAMAVDAKDQVTHGHIRRVQRYALGLSRFLGINDERILKAVEAAALLHDMGKLAIPEYILNKPGKLTPAEFDKMKLHAGLGADILSAIQFPYPVVPIVRHHHENWDGTGYPDRLKGTEIPLGARILSVVDCYDALTSDRPYRSKLSSAEALSIVMQRRGTMYDPLVVDTFVNKLEELERSAQDLGPVNPTLVQIAELNTVLLPDAKTTIPTTRPPLRAEDVAPMALGLLGSVPGIKGCIFYLASDKSTSMAVASVAGIVPAAEYLVDAELGERVVGWSAATRSLVRNAALELEFGSHVSSGEKCCSFPTHTPEGTTAVFLILSGQDALPDESVDRIASMVDELVSAIREPSTAWQSQAAHFSLGRFLPSDRRSAEACFPLGVIAIRIPAKSNFTEASLRTLVRSKDSIVVTDSGTVVVIIPRASETAVLGVVERMKSASQSEVIETTFKWTVLNDFSTRIDGQVFDVLRSLEHQPLRPLSDKLH